MPMMCVCDLALRLETALHKLLAIPNSPTPSDWPKYKRPYTGRRSATVPGERQGLFYRDWAELPIIKELAPETEIIIRDHI